MLVLTRKPNQSILIGEDIEIRVLQVRGEQVRLGIRAPHNVPIYREEILQVSKSKEGRGPEAEPKEASDSEERNSPSATD